ncbi:hypothetical protein QMK19_00005 [Streptomyces sp. H10-C2]|uniref:hypothetical protein n=1 Tax=unclassified Streptomyces TaxID=2593676 RepID=UPI0024B9D0CB|nr:MULTISPECIES: hypothetical protein [unclassified Streptomyces]MDJ0340446.1 hypothetical protein [Streptomyces sp. PH10-H1]MDJ0368106.1 hypothetical protein [Streptomyces sp. H10-C2]
MTWQIWSHRLTGGRVQVLALRERLGRDWVVSTSVVNVGRQDVSLIGYTVWLEPSGMRWKRIKWKARMLPRYGFAHVRRLLITVPPSLNITGKAWLRDDQDSVQFPLVIRAGTTLRLPNVTLGWVSDAKFQPRVGIHVGSGRIVQAEVLAADAFEPIDISTEYDVVAHMEIDVRSDAQLVGPDSAPGRPTRITTSVRSRGDGRMDVAISTADARDRDS